MSPPLLIPPELFRTSTHHHRFVFSKTECSAQLCPPSVWPPVSSLLHSQQPSEYPTHRKAWPFPFSPGGLLAAYTPRILFFPSCLASIEFPDTRMA